ncbi:MAG: hypothetical protein ACO1NM_07575 [Sphingobium phenoxybenzoativorans]|uniref:Uncharacterized protein n=1 Tax=Sphingobium phenoxybenzoativorans TaxID=1592790 RepID=A0A975Q2S7_9SPHN|nr:hypothetical protein [Sphingobium phenoxybenzoativorans]QUT07001.1 hypothetical protein KFK14_06125 [Sphingobium phenoxybenzoativorans]
MRITIRMKALGAVAAVLVAGTPAMAQYGGAGPNGGSGIRTRDAVNAAILSDVSSDRQAEREAKRTPYASPGYGSIRTAKQAADACGADAVSEAGRGSKLIGKPLARTMATGWEVEGHVDTGDGHVPFVCSVRNGSVSGILLK